MKKIVLILLGTLIFVGTLMINGCAQPKYPKLQGNVNVGNADFYGVSRCVSREEFENNIPTGERCCWIDVFGYIQNIGNDTAEHVKVNCKTLNIGKVTYKKTKNIGDLGIDSNIRFDIKIDNIGCFRQYNIPAFPKTICEVTCSNCQETLELEGGY